MATKMNSPFSSVVPTLLVDEKKCRANIGRMAARARAGGVRLRPHFKTHQNHEVGRWFRDYGVDAITVSSLRMASFFAADGWDDITVAFPVNILEMERINDLARQIRLNLLVGNTAAVQALHVGLQHAAGVFIKADTGYHRTGLGPDQTDTIDEVLDAIASSPLLTFRGFLGHAGHSYAARSKNRIAAVHAESLAVMDKLRRRYLDRHPDMIISVGDTPTCSVMDTFPGADEIRPGNFVYYDLMQWQIGSCSLSDISVAVACPVVALHPERGELVLYGGGVHFSKDRLSLPDGNTLWGLVGQWAGTGWTISENGPRLVSLSQEHGIVSSDPAWIAGRRVGELLPVLPVHSCMTADLLRGDTRII